MKIVFIVVGVVLFLSGCGAGTENNSGTFTTPCGPGTQLVNGLCTPIPDDDGNSSIPTDPICGTGTVLTNGQCQVVQNDDPEPTQVSCGEGTTLVSGQCEVIQQASTLVCGEGTVLEGNSCVVKDPNLDGDNNIDTFPCTEAFENGVYPEVIGDGFGWNGVESCSLPVIAVDRGQCVDRNLTGAYTDKFGLVCNPLNRNNYPIRYTLRPYWSYYRTPNSLVLNNLPYSISYSQFNSSTVRLYHDNSFLHIYVRTVDGALLEDSALNQLHQDDGWELFIDAGAERNGTYDENDYQLLGGWGLGTPRLWQGFNSKLSLNPVVTCANRGTARECKISISLDSLGVRQNTTRTIGWDLQINQDIDGGLRDFKHGSCGPYQNDTTWFDPSSFNCSVTISR